MLDGGCNRCRYTRRLRDCRETQERLTSTIDASHRKHAGHGNSRSGQKRSRGYESPQTIGLGSQAGDVILLPDAEWLVVKDHIRTGQGSFVVELATGRRSPIAPPGQFLFDVELFGKTLRVPGEGRQDGLWDLSVCPHAGSRWLSTASIG
jgi:hypothetical protein